MSQEKSTLGKLQEFKNKYYLNLLLRGAIFSAALTLSIFIIFTYLEFFLHLNKTFREILFFSFLIIVLASFYNFILKPLIILFKFKKQITDESAAAFIGKKFTGIDDKLLNTIQLLTLKSKDSLATASLSQREAEFQSISFASAVNFNENTRFLKFLFPPLIVLIVLLIAFPSSILESTTRIINFNKHYEAEAPFEFILNNKTLKAYKNEDLLVSVSLKGRVAPDLMYLVVQGRKYKMEQDGNSYAYTFKKIQREEVFHMEAAGFLSDDYTIEVLNRPSLFDLNVVLNFPSYLNRKAEAINNAGNLNLPEGTQVTWNFNTSATDSVIIALNEQKLSATATRQNVFSLSKSIKENTHVNIKLKNGSSTNKEAISYQINVTKDQFPSINFNALTDTLLYNHVVLNGALTDDYGLSKFQLFYKIENGLKSNSDQGFRRINMALNNNSANQNFYYNWKLDSLNLNPGDKLNFYLQLWDNDGVNGAKSTKSKFITVQLPGKESVREISDKSDQKTEGDINKTLEATKALKKELESLKDDLKLKKKSGWQEQKKLEELMDKKVKLEEQIKKLQEQNSTQNQQKEKFLKPEDKIMDKLKELEKLMNNLLDDETKKLYEELQKLLKEQKNEQIPDVLEKINKKEINLEKELERALEMFKKMEFEQKLDNVVKDLKDLKEKQDQLAKESLDKKNNIDSLIKKQEEVNKEFKAQEKKLDELQELNKELENPEPWQETKEEEKKVEESQENSLKDLKDNKNKKASESQSKSGQDMKKLSDKLESMQSSMEMESQEQNIGNLREILENLLSLSFDQEALMKDFKNVNQSDPRYISLSQKQLKIKDDAKIIEDSLLSLAKKVFQIQSFITREVSEMNGYIDESLDNLKKRRPGIAASKQQFAMKSMNDLALLLNDALKQMQEQMANAKGEGKKSKGKKKGNSPGLGDLQKQLNERINQLMKGGKTGKALSEEVAQLAAEQEMIRQALEKLGMSMGGNKPGSGNIPGILKDMEKTEEELVNKKYNSNTVERQQEILTRLLDSEKAQKEREFEEKREATSAKDLENQNKDQFSEYLKIKEKEIEYIKTLPPSLNTYYKNQINNYFKALKN